MPGDGDHQGKSVLDATELLVPISTNKSFRRNQSSYFVGWYVFLQQEHSFALCGPGMSWITQSVPTHGISGYMLWTDRSYGRKWDKSQIPREQNLASPTVVVKWCRRLLSVANVLSWVSLENEAVFRWQVDSTNFSWS